MQKYYRMVNHLMLCHWIRTFENKINLMLIFGKGIITSQGWKGISILIFFQKYDLFKIEAVQGIRWRDL